MSRFTKAFILTACIAMLTACKSCKDKTNIENPDTTNNTHDTINPILGFNILNHVKGIWDGPVTSTTPLGGYSQWIVDFRPISENQISAKNELDTANDIFMSFFIAKHNNQLKLAFRNGGSFINKKEFLISF